MTTFTTAIDQALAGPNIRSAEFVRLSITDPQSSTATVYCMSTSFQNETVTDQNNISSIATGTYTALGGLVTISGHQRDLSATSYDTVITLVGIDPNKIRQVLEIGYNPATGTYHAGIKGAKIQIWRGFYTADYHLIDTPQLRYTGIVTKYAITEDRTDRVDSFVLSLNCSSFKTVLENRNVGRHTNGNSWNPGINPEYNPSGQPQNLSWDTSMDRIQAIHQATFNFGQKL